MNYFEGLEEDIFRRTNECLIMIGAELTLKISLAFPLSCALLRP